MFIVMIVNGAWNMRFCWPPVYNCTYIYLYNKWNYTFLFLKFFHIQNIVLSHSSTKLWKYVHTHTLLKQIFNHFFFFDNWKKINNFNLFFFFLHLQRNDENLNVSLSVPQYNGHQPANRHFDMNDQVNLYRQNNKSIYSIGNGY